MKDKQVFWYAKNSVSSGWSNKGPYFMMVVEDSDEVEKNKIYFNYWK